MTRRERIAIIWVIVAALLLGGAAKAADAKPYPPPAEGWGAAIWRAAVTVWDGPPPNCGTLTVEYDRTPLYHPDRLGEATLPDRPGTECFAHMATIPDAYPRPARIELLCNITLHEYGHLMGEGHVSDPHALMYGDPFDAAPGAPPWEYAGNPACWKFGHWQRWQAYLASERAAGD